MAGPIFTKLFSTSPMSYLKKHVGLVVNIVALAQRFQAASQAGDWAECDRLFVEIEDTEREADKLKAEFQLHLPRGVFLPVYRSDLLEIMIILDLRLYWKRALTPMICNPMEAPRCIRLHWMGIQFR